MARTTELALAGSGVRRPTQARAQAKVEAILDAADAAVRAAGSGGLAMRDVARRAGVKPSTLYDWFPTRELLLRALEDRAWERAAETARDVLARAQRETAAGRRPPLAFVVAEIVESAVRAMAPAARLYGLTAESPFGRARREALGARFAAIATEALAGDASPMRDLRGGGDGDGASGGGGGEDAHDLGLRLAIATEAVALLTWVGGRDHPDAFADGSYAREVGRLIAHYLARDPAPAPLL